MERRFEGDIGNDCLLSVDTVDFQIHEPGIFEVGWSNRWWCHKNNEPGLRYEIGLSIIGGRICWINGPFACGLYNDWKIFNEFGLRQQLENNERVEADNGYRAGDPEYCKTPYGPLHDQRKERQGVRRRVMGRQEAINKYMKDWKVLKEIFRHDMKKHSNVLHAVAVICQVKIDNRQPLYSCADYSDFE